MSLDRVGEVNLILGDLNAAAAAYGESLAIRRRLVDLDQSNTLWQDGVSLTLEKITDFKRVVEDSAAALAEDRSAGKTSAGLQAQPSLTNKVRKVKDVAIVWAVAAYEESLAITRNLLQQSATLAMRGVVRKLAPSFSELTAAVITPLRRYRRVSSAFIVSLSAKVRVGVQSLHHATETMGLVPKWSIFEWSNHHNASSPDGNRIEAD